MCGRYTLTTKVFRMKTYYGVDLVRDFPWTPRFNIAPTQMAPVVVRNDDGRTELKAMRWGLVPFWAKELSIGSKMINARAETLAEKPAFREALKKRRCLVPADGFYEWKAKASGPKQPYRILLKDSDLFSFAGLWETWRDPANPDQAVETFTIVTTAANEAVRPLHERMPVILEREREAEWLDAATGTAPARIQACLKAPPSEAIRYYPVSVLVNSPRNDREDLIAEQENERDKTHG